MAFPAPTSPDGPPRPEARGRGGIYVEVRVRGEMEALWERTQDPAQHRRWDLRFTDIRYLPRPDDREPQRFLYATRIGFGLGVDGEGEAVGTREGPDGTRASALRFWSDDLKSLIREGSGYWKYIPTGDGIRFLTWYDYRTRFGALGRLVDAALFRPLIGWATAWSFDRLRLWIERGIDPEVSLHRSLVHAIARSTLALVFVYHGLVPKLLARHPDERTMLGDAGVPAAWLGPAIVLFGASEVAWGLLLLALWGSRWPLLLTSSAMIPALMVVGLRSPGYLVAAFNPVTLNLAVMALGLIGWLAGRDLPTAAHCLRRPPDPER